MHVLFGFTLSTWLPLTHTHACTHMHTQEVIKNLGIATVEFRGEADRDVAPYVHERGIEVCACVCVCVCDCVWAGGVRQCLL